MPRADVDGIVLAGGRSTRFGSEKLAAEFQGSPLLHRAIVRVSQVCDEVVVVIARAAEEPDLPAGVRVRIARDAKEGQGPLAGLASGLRSTSSKFTLVAAGDMPDLQVAVLEELIRVAERDQADAVALEEGGSIRPLPAVLRTELARDTADELLAHEERSLRALLDSLDVKVISERRWHELDPAGLTLYDVDEPNDLDLDREQGDT